MKFAVIGASGRMGQIHMNTALEWGAQMTDPDRADIVIIASPDNTHAEYTKWHLMRGQGVFCEKPLATNMEDLNRLEGLALLEPLGCHLPLRQFAKDFEIEGTAVELIYDYGRKNKFLNSWRNEPNYDLVMGGGVHLMDLWMQKTDIHNIDVVWSSRARSCDEAKCPDSFLGKFTSGQWSATLRVDFTKEGTHSHIIRWATGMWVNEKPTDKVAQLRAFLDSPKTDTAAIAAHRACLQFQ